MYIKNLKNTRLEVSAVKSASFINEVVNSKIFVASHQIRIHHSYHTEFWLVARSNPIIEHCENLGFGDLTTTDFGKQPENVKNMESN